MRQIADRHCARPVKFRVRGRVCAVVSVHQPESLQAQILHDKFHWDSDAPSPHRRLSRGRSSMPNSKPCKFVMQKRICMVRSRGVWRGVGSHPLPCKTHAAVNSQPLSFKPWGLFIWRRVSNYSSQSCDSGTAMSNLLQGQKNYPPRTSACHLGNPRRIARQVDGGLVYFLNLSLDYNASCLISRHPISCVLPSSRSVQ
jgi:hypothetical protein